MAAPESAAAVLSLATGSQDANAFAQRQDISRIQGFAAPVIQAVVVGGLAAADNELPIPQEGKATRGMDAGEIGASYGEARLVDDIFAPDYDS